MWIIFSYSFHSDLLNSSEYLASYIQYTLKIALRDVIDLSVKYPFVCFEPKVACVD